MRLAKDDPPATIEAAGRPSFFPGVIAFTVQFAAVALLLSLAIGIVTGRYIARGVQNRTIAEAARSTEELAVRQVAIYLGAEQIAGPLAGEAYERFDAHVWANILSSQIVGVNLRSPDGTVVYSSNPAIHGKRLPKNDGIEAALSGRTFTEVEPPSEDERAGFAQYGRVLKGQVLKVYTPLVLTPTGIVGVPYMSPDYIPILGVLEVYRDYTPILAEIHSLQRIIYIALAAALGVLYLVLVLVVYRGSNIIRRQRADLQRRADNLRSSYESLVSVLCAALDLRDHVTSGHAHRVTDLASVVARQMGLPKEEARQIEKAAILHDIGKIGVADTVLSKPGPLSEVEWAEMKRHPELGYQIIQGIGFLKEVAEIVYAHHERFDGHGYPRGLQGEAIPLGARIFAVVDAYDAMTSHRPYRRAVPHREAVVEIIRNSGTQFDPRVVRAFLEAEKRDLLEGSHDGDAVEMEPSRAGVKV